MRDLDEVSSCLARMLFLSALQLVPGVFTLCKAIKIQGPFREMSRAGQEVKNELILSTFWCIVERIFRDVTETVLLSTHNICFG